MSLPKPADLPRLVAIYSHAPQSGKSTAALHLERVWGYRLVKFAGALRNVLHSFLLHFGYTSDQAREFLLSDINKSVSLSKVPGRPTPRRLMISLGQWGRSIDPDVWVAAAVNAMAAVIRPDARFVIDDLRFPNEWKFVKDRGGLILKVERPGFGPVEMEAEGELAHLSPDYIVSGDSVDGLHKSVNQALRTWVNGDC